MPAYKAEIEEFIRRNRDAIQGDDRNPSAHNVPKRLYDLRHTCATLLLAAGENPKIVSERLGHASVALTLDTYSHVLPDMQQAAADKLEALLFSSQKREI